jgi:glutamate racemase
MVTYHLSAQAPIGIFDSGIGGTTVLRKLTQCLPNEKILYFGDTARLPYGNKTPAQICIIRRRFYIGWRLKALKWC